MSRKKDVERLVNLMFSRDSIPGITGSFWHYDIGEVYEPGFKKKVEDDIWESDRSLGAIFKIMLEEMTKRRGYTRFCAKFPVFVNFVPKLIEWYPECKIVHVTRDPRSVAASRTNDPGGTKMRIKRYPRLGFVMRRVMIFLSVAQYVWTSRLHQKYEGLKNYALFHYEDLLADPEQVVRRLCHFTETNFLPEMLDPKPAQASSLTGRTSRGFNKEAAIHWKSMLSNREERLVWCLTRRSRKRFGYEGQKHPVFKFLRQREAKA